MHELIALNTYFNKEYLKFIETSFPYRTSLILAFCCLISLCSYGQRGPGGVSVDSDNQKNCRLWLDAGDLTDLADGDSVIAWYDKSISDVLDSAFRDPLLTHKYTYPIFRNSPSASINGKPVISYESGGMLGIGKWPNGSESGDLNSNPVLVTTYEQTMFFAFRTSNDVDSRQVIWEEGGAARGLTAYIYDGSIYIGAYDVNGGDNDNDDYSNNSVPGFGFTYKKLPVQANTTYVLGFKYDVPTDNTLILNSTSTAFTGTLNGQSFPINMQRGDGSENSYCGGCANGVGGIWTHSDPVGIGGVNQGTYYETGRIYGGSSSDSLQNFIKRNKYTGSNLFKGRIAEICYYAFALNKAEQIIVENYLAAKYFANVIANDKFVYESSFGDGVIGIGRQQSTPTEIEHNHSQGDNLFEISVSNMSSAFNTTPQYLLVGHNNASISWTTQNTPDSASVQRLRRIWRWDQTGGNTNQAKTVHIHLDASDIAKLPPLPSGFSKYGVIIGDEDQPLPNFTSDHGQVIELTNAGGNYFADIQVKDGNYLTLCAIKPIVQFRVASNFAIEDNAGVTPKTAILDLNYTPSFGTSFDVGFDFIDGAATLGNDYQWSSADSPVTFSAGETSKTIDFDIVNDATTTNDLPVETFTINITGVNNGLTIGPRSMLTYSIYDNDPPPKVTFETATVDYNENAGTVNIPLKVIGNLTNSATATVEYIAGSGTATENDDFTVTSPQVLHYNASTFTDDFIVTIKEDLLDEYDEHFTLRIVSTTGDLGFSDTLNIELQVNIIDNDLEPNVSFVSSSSEGYESISEPQVLVRLSARSAKTLTVPFSLIGGTATNGAANSGADYDANPVGGTLIFEPGDSIRVLYQNNTTGDLSFFVYGNDPSPEPDETVIFQLDNNPQNAGIGAIDEHTYTIRDYTEFEWQGAAGIGKLNDNTIWMVPDEANNGSDIPNLSPRPIQIIQNDSSRTPTLTTRAGGLNNKKLLQFDGVDDYLIPGNPSAEYPGQSALIQTAAFYNSKSIFLVVIPEEVNSSTPQCIFETGAQKCGLSIYIIDDKLYFQAWGWQNNNPQQGLWGLDPSGGHYYGIAYTEYDGLIAGQPYIISCHYENNFNTTPTIPGLSLFVNGELIDTYDGDVRQIQSNIGSAGLGSVLWQSRFIHTNRLQWNHSGSTVPSPQNGNTSNFFKGKMGDFLYYNEPRMNLARVRIITNYLSARYNIPLISSSQDFDLAYADNTPTAVNPAFNYEVAGVGKVDSVIHGDSQGESELRVRDAQFNNGSSPAFLMWGNNGESLTDTWPVSTQPLPANIEERSAKVWRFTANPANATDNADFRIRYNQAENATEFTNDPDALKLLISSDPDDFSSATVYPVSSILSGHVAEFSDIPVTDGMYLALGNSSPIYPLPIELLSFSAKLNGNAVDLNWATASETNNERFEIERTGEDLAWKKIGEVPGAGNSNTTLYYQEKDRRPLSGVSYYRLKQIDFDGGYEYSDVVSVINQNTTSDDILLFPNPSNSGSVFIRVPYVLAKADARITIFSISGIKVKEEQIEGGSMQRSLNFDKLTPGTYFVRIELNGIQETKKWLVQY